MEFPSRLPVWLGDVLDVSQFVSYLRSAERTRPVVVLSIDRGKTAPYVSVDELAGQAAGRADIVVIPTDDLTRAFTDAVAEGASVYRGAARVYYPGMRWEERPYSVPLRLAQTPDQIRELPRLVQDDLRKALEPTPPAVRRPERPATGGRDTGSWPPAPVGARPGVPLPAPGGARPRPVPGPPGGARPTPTRIETPADSKVLADYLMSPSRQQPVVVVSRAAGATEATADLEELRHDLAGLADVCEITTLDASWEFSRLVPPLCQVYGGAGRVYPVGTGWTQDPYLSPLRLALDFAGRSRLTRQLVSDTMRMASRGSYATRIIPAGEHPVTATVTGVAEGWGLVKLDSGEMGVLWPELVEPDMSAERLFARGMEVRGDFDPESHRIDVRGMRQDPLEAVAGYAVDDTILVRVEAVEATTCTVALMPGLSVVIPAVDITDDPDPDLRGLMSVGETLPALLLHRESDTGEWLLSLADAKDPDEAVPAPAILTGGPPWLVPPAPAPEGPPAAEPARALKDLARLEGDTEIVRELRLEMEQLMHLLEQANLKVEDLEEQVRSAKTQRREGQRRSRADRAANKKAQDAADQSLFLDEAEQMDFEIRLAWARRIPPSDKANRPLLRWSYSPQFFETLAQVQGELRDKIVSVIVDVLTGRDVELASRELHQLRTGPGGEDPFRVRNNGQDTCWRVSIQVKSPSARRLHFWRCADGSIELASVRLHDDYDT